MKATLLLRKDHENLQSMLQQFTSGSRKDRDAQFTQIQREIEMHSRIEQELFYPELENSALSEAVEAGRRAVAEHQSIDALAQELGELGIQHKQFQEKLQELVALIQAHLTFEEDELFEEARKVLSEYRLEELGLEMEDRRRFLQLSAA
jgi:hemerythrin superfamily protein